MDADSLRQEARRYRRLARAVNDERTVATLEEVALEFELRASAAEQEPSSGGPGEFFGIDETICRDAGGELRQPDRRGGQNRSVPRQVDVVDHVLPLGVSGLAKLWLARHGNDALGLARDMIAELEESGITADAEMWRRIVIAMEELKTASK
jgi:hypothetical protein